MPITMRIKLTHNCIEAKAGHAVPVLKIVAGEVLAWYQQAGQLNRALQIHRILHVETTL